MAGDGHSLTHMFDPDDQSGELDVITIGRSSVDLYGEQIGTRLEDVASFAKSVGGCPANIAIGTSRLGLQSGLITRVGDEQMGRYIREQMRREGVNQNGVITDPERLTALVILSVEDDESFPLIFYRENCSDMALCEADIDPDFIARAKAIVVTGTHFSQPNTAAAQMKAIEIAKGHDRKVAFDIDYRPNLWGLAGHDAGDQRYVASSAVSEQLKGVLAHCDLIVGTEEEVLIASGCEDLLDALKTIRSLTPATIVLKRGPMGCIVYDGAIEDDLEAGIIGQGFPIEVYNVLGAGDAFMSGFLRGWLRGESLETAATWANACGAFAVSRLLCSPEIPTWPELQLFLEQGSPHRALRKDQAINHVHWATTRRADIPGLMAFAIDHRTQFEALRAETDRSSDCIGAFKVLAVKAAAQVAKNRPGFGMLIDERYGRKAMYEFARHDFSWLGRPVEKPGSRPLEFEFGEDIGSQLVEWPVDHCIKCLCFYHPDDPDDLKQVQQRKLLGLYEASRRIGRELLVEIIASKNGEIGPTTTSDALSELYALGIKPDWWKLEPQEGIESWKNIETVIANNDPWCRGIVMLGLDAPSEQLGEAFEAAKGADMVKGFAVGRTIFMETARDWFENRVSDEQAITDMADRFSVLVERWKSVR